MVNVRLPTMRLLILLTSIMMLAIPCLAQFNFNFGNMFNQQQQQEPQNMASDSDWYRSNYDNGTTLLRTLTQDLSLGHDFGCNS